VNRRPVRRRARAEIELLSHVERIAERDLDAALRFADAIEEAIALIRNHPEIGAPYESADPRLIGFGNG